MAGGVIVTGEGTSPDTLMAAGQPGTPLPPRPQRATKNDATRVSGLVAEGHCGGETDLERSVPWT